MRICVIGNRGFSETILRHLAEDWNVVGAVGSPASIATDRADFTLISGVAEELGIPATATDDINDEATIEFIAEIDPDVCLCVGWTQIIDRAVLDIPAEGFLGLHASLLPEGRGGAPVNWSIIHGEDEVGMSLFYFVEAIDEGDIVQQTTVPIQERDDVYTVYERLSAASLDLLDSALPKIDQQTAHPKSQDRSSATYRPNRKPEDGLIEWEDPAVDLWNFIRALTDPYPGAFTFFDGRKLTFWDASISDRDCQEAQPGGVIEAVDGEGLLVCSGNRALCLERVQLGDGPRLWGDESADQFGIEPGTVLGKPSDYPTDWIYTGIRGRDGSTHFDTNLEVDEKGFVYAVVRAQPGVSPVKVVASFSGNTIANDTLKEGHFRRTRIPYTPTSAGVHTLVVTFFRNGVEIDRRYLKVFASV